MKQWVSCLTILLGLVLSICPIKSYAFSTAYGEAYIDLLSLNISVDGDVLFYPYYSYATSHAWLDSDKTGYIDDYSDNVYSPNYYYYIGASVEADGFPTKYSQAEVEYYPYYAPYYGVNYGYDGHIASTVNVDSNGIEWVDLGADAVLQYQIESPEDGNGGSFTASVNYSLRLDLTTTALNERIYGVVGVSADISGDYWAWNWHDYSLESEVADGDFYYDEVTETLQISGYLYPGDSAVVSFVSYAEAYTTAPVPVPSTILLLGSGMLWMVGYRRKCLTQKP